MPIMKIELAFIILAECLFLAKAARELLDVDFANLPDNPSFNVLLFGTDTIAHAGDVNNDGFADLVIGMPDQNAVIGSDKGNAYLLFGKPGGFQSGIDMLNDPWDRANGITISGVLSSSDGNFLGSSVGYAGDMNADGIDDFYVAAARAAPGVVYIIFGRSDLNDHDIDLSTSTSSDWIKIVGEGPFTTGSFCSRLGDVNGDTIDDFALSAQNGESNKGVVYIIFGAHGLSSNIALASTSFGIKIIGESAGDQIGANVNYSGDLNGDGISDIVIGASSTSPNSISFAGTVYLVFGKLGLSDIPDIGSLIPADGIQIMATDPFANFGIIPTKSGDLNGDGLNDLAISYTYGSSGAGIVYVFFGKNLWSSRYLSSFSSSDGIQIIGVDSSTQIATWLEFCDINEDGIPDIFVSAQDASPLTRSQAGIIYVILGKTGITDVMLSTFDDSQGITMIGDTSYQLGNNLLLTGDFNNDGQDDMIVRSSSPDGTYIFYTSTLQVPLPPAPPSESESNGYGKMIERIVDFETTAGTIIGITTSGLQMSQSGVMAVMTGVLLAKQLQFVRYIDVGYSPRLMLTFQKQPYNLVTVNFGPLFPESLEGEAFRYPASPRFARYINRLLVVNFWRGLTTFGILLIVLCAAFILSKIPIKNPTLKLVRDKLQSFIILNYMFSFVLSNTDNIILFSIVEYKSFKLDGGLATASFIISIVCLLVLLGILLFIPWHLYRLRKHRKYQKKEEKLQAYDSSRVLFEEVKDKYFIQQLYLFILCFRVVLHNIIIGALETPTLQASLLIVLNFLMVIYIVTLLPHQKIITNIEVVGYEIMIFIANVTCLCIATLEPAQQPNAVVAGDVILILNIIIIAFSMLISALKVLFKVLPTINEKLAERKKKSIETEQTPLPLQTPTEDCLPSPEKSPKHTEMEGESLLVVPEEDIDSIKISTKISSPMRPLDTLGKMESNRELLITDQ